MEKLKWHGMDESEVGGRIKEKDIIIVWTSQCVARLVRATLSLFAVGFLNRGPGNIITSRRRHTRCSRDWSSDVCSSDLIAAIGQGLGEARREIDARDKLV